jgi:hypothetical protein
MRRKRRSRHYEFDDTIVLNEHEVEKRSTRREQKGEGGCDHRRGTTNDLPHARKRFNGILDWMHDRIL